MTWVVAHRGASRDRPENTLAAFEEALDQGCDAVELDVQLSRDGEPVVYHDRTLVRAGGGRRRVARLDWAELRRLGPGPRAGNRSPALKIPSLEQVLKRFADRTRLMIEIKLRSTPERHLLLARTVAQMVRGWNSGTDVHMLCFDALVLDECERVAPEIPRVLNLKARRGLTAEQRRRLPSIAALSVDVRTLNSRFLRDARRAGVPLMVFTCNTPSRVEAALTVGATAVFSDRPGWLTGYLRSRDAAR